MNKSVIKICQFLATNTYRILTTLVLNWGRRSVGPNVVEHDVSGASPLGHIALGHSVLGQEVSGPNVVGHDVSGAIPLGQSVPGAQCSGAERRDS